MKSFILCGASCLFMLLTACASLHPHDSAWGDAGEVAIRVVIAPLTLGTSELILMADEKYQKDKQARQDWLNRMGPEERSRQDRRDAAAMLGLGMALSGSRPFQSLAPSNQAPAYPIMPLPQIDRPSMNCTSNTVGQQTYTNCQ
jgi:hypothetical protein